MTRNVLTRRRWPFLGFQRDRRLLSALQEDSTVDMYAVPASPADREKQSALVTNLGAATVERQESSAAIQMARERSQRGMAEIAPQFVFFRLY